MSMSVTDIQTSQGMPGAPAKSTGTTLGKEEFMRLLMTQLQAQDPLNPMDSTAFVAQLSQFASLEQQVNQSKKLDDLITITGANNSANSVSLLGKEIRYDGNQIQGPSTVYYDLGSDAANVQIEVRDELGHVVKTLTNQPGKAGLHEVKVEDLAKGKYKVFVNAKDGSDKDVAAKLSIGDVVTGVNFSGNVPNLLLASGGEMPANQLIEIRQPKGN